MATDSIGTACNIAGDGAIAIVVDWRWRHWNAKRAESRDLKVESRKEK
jgi:Na+/H+-dicarboxylate symporter